jgi:hypothetical protein
VLDVKGWSYLVGGSIFIQFLIQTISHFPSGTPNLGHRNTGLGIQLCDSDHAPLSEIIT